MSASHQDILRMLQLVRRHLAASPGCERTTLCGADCMLRILQLAMAEVHKQVQMLEFISAGSQDSEERDQIIASITTPSRRPTQDIAKLRSVMKRVVCAYLGLLVNTKNDLALASVLNVPDRGLGRDAFTHLRHAARDKQMSLFLVATSFIRTIELGGKGYAPSQSDPLRTHVKGLALFVGFIDKLDEMLGEISDPRTAVVRILSTIKMALIRGRCSGDRYCTAVVDVVQDLELRIQNIINAQNEVAKDLIPGVSPARPKMHAINHGTASCGRDAVKALLVLLDEEAASPPTRNTADLLCADEENASFFGADSMLTLFRSPEQSNDASPKSLKHRVHKSMEGKEKLKQTLIRSQFACTYKDDYWMNRKQPEYPSLSQVPTCVHPAPKLVSALCFDEEPVPAAEAPRVARPALGLISGNLHQGRGQPSKGQAARPQGQKSAKRKQVDLNSENIDCEAVEPPHKKTVGAPKVSKKPQNKDHKASDRGTPTRQRQRLN
ncbi:PCNA-interacting partner isoform X2 [Ambystoma mexicanum]|uniref:PCNA-interacting partner isoform X2 n=1 Tax=Ambystoma mexicanum TaxID=8296 RepID=UPI0037E7426D